MTYMTIVVSGVISAATGAIVAAIASFLVIKYQLKRNMQQATLLAVDEALRRQIDNQHKEAVTAIGDMRSYSHSILYSLHSAAITRNADELRQQIIRDQSFEMLHKEVWLAATKVPASVIGAFYAAYLQYRVLQLACTRPASKSERDSDKWLKGRQTEVRQLLESFRTFVDEGALYERRLTGEPDFPVHGSPTDYWPPSS